MAYSKERIQAVVNAANDKFEWKPILSDLGINEYRELGDSLELKCPFHEDKRPSFRANMKSKMYHCFSCGRAGSIIYFMYKMSDTNISFSAYCNNILREDKYLQNKLGFSSVTIKDRDITSAFTEQRKFNKASVAAVTMSYNTLFNRVKKCGLNWENFVTTMTLLQNDVGTNEVCAAVESINNMKKGNREQVSLMDLI